MSMARALHGVSGVSLERLGPLYGLGEKGTELANAKGKRREHFTEADWLKLGVYCNQDVALTDGLLTAMTKGFPREELWTIDTTVRCFTEPIFEGDQSVLAKTYADEVAKKAQLLKNVAVRAGVSLPPGATPEQIQEAARVVLASGDKFAALLRTLGVEPPMKPNPKGAMIYAFAKDDPGMQGLLEHESEEIRDLADARLSVKSTITETRSARMIGIAKRGAVPMYLKYCGAHTHRWSGGDKMNPQNFTRGGALRDAILAPEGRVLAVADSGQIEARVLPWLAGQANLLDTFRRNDLTAGDFYSDIGSTFFLKKISKKETPIERQLSKNMILGLGFNMGCFKFAGSLLKGMLGADPVQFTAVEAAKFNVDVEAFERRRWGQSSTCGDEVENTRTFGSRLEYEPLLIHTAVADHFVRVYRAANPAIVGLWKAMDKLLEEMARPGGDPHEVRMTFKCLKIIHHGIVKPGGLVLHYPDLRKGPGGFSYLGGKSGKQRQKIYGGLLVENLVQSIARDVVAEQALWVRAGGYKIGTTTHDEIVAVPFESDGQVCLDYMLERMRIPPAYCVGLPMNASGGFGKSYGAVT